MEDDTVPNENNNLLLGHVTHVIDPSNFWIQIGTKELFEGLNQLEEEVQEFCEEVGTVDPDAGCWMEDGCYVVAKSSLSSARPWRRAQIARHNIEKGSVDVFYLDYGTTEILSLDQICVAVPAFFFAVHHQTWKCGLAGIRPIAKTWTTRGVKCFQKLVEGEETLQVAIVSYGASFMCHKIALYTGDGGSGRSLAHLMLDEEVGMPCDVDDVAEYAHDVVQVFPQCPVEDIQQDSSEDRLQDEVEDQPSYEFSPASQPSHDEQAESGDISGRSELSKDSVEPLSPQSPAVTIPGFNLNTIFKTKMASADIITQKKEDERKKTVTSEMEKDLKMVQQDMEGAAVETEEVTEWGASDYDIGKQVYKHQTDVFAQKVAVIRAATGDKNWTPSMTEGHGPQKPVLQEIKAEAMRPASPKTSQELSQIMAPTTSQQQQRVGNSPTPGERLESQLSQQLSKILDEGDLEDPGALCDQFNQLVQPGSLKEPWGLSVAIEVLLEMAVTLKGPHVVTVLNVLDTYVDSANFDVRMETILRQLESRFVKPPFGKARTYHKEFGQVLGQLLILSRLWNRHTADMVQNFVLNIVEKWAIYNRNGYHIGLQYEKIQQMYTDCLEGVWLVAADIITDLDPSTFTRIHDWLQEKVLAQTHPREIREQVLKLLLKLSPMKVFDAEQIRPKTVSVEVQTEASSFAVPDPNSTAQSHMEDSSLFSHFDTEIEDISPVAGAGQGRDEVYHQCPATSQQPPDQTVTSNAVPAGPYSTWADCVSSGKHKNTTRGPTDQGLKALALQTLSGEKYVFSGKFVQDLPPRFKKHMGAQQNVTEESPESAHFYRKGEKNIVVSGLDYQTPKQADSGDEVKDIGVDEVHAGKSVFTRCGLGEFPSVKDILNSSHGQNEMESDTGSESQARSLTPVDTGKHSPNEGRSRSAKSKRATLPTPHSPDHTSALNANAKEWVPSTPPVGQTSKTHLGRSPVGQASRTHLMTSPVGQASRMHLMTSPVGQASRTHLMTSPVGHASRSPLRTSPGHSSSRPDVGPNLSSSSSEDLSGSWKTSPQKSGHNSSSSIKSIVEDIFGGRGDFTIQSDQGQVAESSEIEKLVVADSNTDDANTSFSVSEITSEVEDEQSTVNNSNNAEFQDTPKCPIQPAHTSQYGFEDDMDEDDYDGFLLSVEGDSGEKDNSFSSCVDSGVVEEMDYMKPMPQTYEQPRQPRYRWVPGKRSCTLCGSTEHTVYSCKKKRSIII
ncbi:uncharacterized protein [Haliotis asinina]|uniref:uncharacterized protein n=1 Tax=Haliotis asinina TaxID=109174 RepID=UPI00353203B6